MTSPYLTAREAAEYLRYDSVESLYRSVGPQRIPCVRRGSRTLLFDRVKLDAWLAGERTGKAAPLKLASR